MPTSLKELRVIPDPDGLPHEGFLHADDLPPMACALGKHGIISSAHKREGDGMSPQGSWPLRRCFYREDVCAPLPDAVALEMHRITRSMGWCDAPQSKQYNTLVSMPFADSHETLWRDQDGCYDLIIELGYNDDPVVAGRGSAIFLHCSKPSLSDPQRLHHTEGCVAIPRASLLSLLPRLSKDTFITIV